VEMGEENWRMDFVLFVDGFLAGSAICAIPDYQEGRRWRSASIRHVCFCWRAEFSGRCRFDLVVVYILEDSSTTRSMVVIYVGDISDRLFWWRNLLLAVFPPLGEKGGVLNANEIFMSLLCRLAKQAHLLYYFIDQPPVLVLE